MRFRKIKCIMKNMKINIQTKGNNVIFKITGDVEILETIIESKKIFEKNIFWDLTYIGYRYIIKANKRKVPEYFFTLHYR